MDITTLEEIRLDEEVPTSITTMAVPDNRYMALASF